MADRNVMVYIESVKGEPVKVGYEMLTPAREIAGGGKVTAAVMDSSADSIANDAVSFGADEVITVDTGDFSAEKITSVLKSLADEHKPDVVLIGSTPAGREIAPRLAARAGAGCVSDVSAVDCPGDSPVYTTPLYGGTILNNVSAVTPLQVVTIRSGAFKKADADTSGSGDIKAETVEVPDSDLKTKITDSVVEISEQVNLEDAEIIVTGGKGMGSEEDFALIQQLADVLGATVGATRPVIEAGWVSRAHQVGQSGKIVAPKLYMAFGVSGATQHVTGMIGSDYIVAVNKDEEAPIFDVADVGIVGDAKKVLPIFIEECKKIKA